MSGGGSQKGRRPIPSQRVHDDGLPALVTVDFQPSSLALHLTHAACFPSFLSSLPP